MGVRMTQIMPVEEALGLLASPKQEPIEETPHSASQGLPPKTMDAEALADPMVGQVVEQSPSNDLGEMGPLGLTP